MNKELLDFFLWEFYDIIPINDNFHNGSKKVLLVKKFAFWISFYWRPYYWTYSVLKLYSPQKVSGPIAYSITGELGESRVDSRFQKKPEKKAKVKRMTLEEAMKNQALKGPSVLFFDVIFYKRISWNHFVKHLETG